MASWIAREAAREEEERPRFTPIAGASEYWEDDEDDAFWVLGTSRARPRTLAEIRSSCPAGMRPSPQQPKRKLPPYIVR